MDSIRTTLGPRGMDKLIWQEGKVSRPLLYSRLLNSS
jgi:hypothetical protein